MCVCVFFFLYKSGDNIWFESYPNKHLFFLPGNSGWWLWGCRCSDRIWRWGEWEAAGRGGAAVCLVYEVVHCRHIWDWHCVRIVKCSISAEITGAPVVFMMDYLPLSLSTGPVFRLWLITCFTAMCAITAATHTSSESKQVGVRSLATCPKCSRMWV